MDFQLQKILGRLGDKIHYFISFHLGMYPFTTSKPARIPKISLYDTTGLPRITRGIISTKTLQTDDLFLASGSEPTINVSGKAGHKIDCWLAIARQENIVRLKGVNGYNPNRISRETCRY